jgi:hypothetical protein
MNIALTICQDAKYKVVAVLEMTASPPAGADIYLEDGGAFEVSAMRGGTNRDIYDARSGTWYVFGRYIEPTELSLTVINELRDARLAHSAEAQRKTREAITASAQRKPGS